MPVKGYKFMLLRENTHQKIHLYKIQNNLKSIDQAVAKLLGEKTK